MIAMVLAMGLSLLVGRNEAAVSLPPEAKALERHFYKKHNICRVIEPYVAHQVKLWWTKDKSITAKLVKLLYSDCMVNVSSFILFISSILNFFYVMNGT